MGTLCKCGNFIVPQGMADICYPCWLKAVTPAAWEVVNVKTHEILAVFKTAEGAENYVNNYRLYCEFNDIFDSIVCNEVFDATLPVEL